MDDLSVGLDRCSGDGASVLFQHRRFHGGNATIANRLLIGGFGIEYGERDVLDAVSESTHMSIAVSIGLQSGAQQQSDVALGQEVLGLVACARRQVGDLADVEAEAAGVEIRGLFGVADIEADVVYVDQIEGVIL